MNAEKQLRRMRSIASATETMIALAHQALTEAQELRRDDVARLERRVVELEEEVAVLRYQLEEARA